MMMCSFGKEQPFAPRWPNNPIRIESSPTRPKNIAIQRTNFDSPESTGVNPRDEPTVNRADITSKMMLGIMDQTTVVQTMEQLKSKVQRFIQENLKLLMKVKLD